MNNTAVARIAKDFGWVKNPKNDKSPVIFYTKGDMVMVHQKVTETVVFHKKGYKSIIDVPCTIELLRDPFQMVKV